MATTTTRDPRFRAELRRQALALYRRERSYRKAAKALGKGVHRTHELVREGLQMEMAEAIEHDERHA